MSTFPITATAETLMRQASMTADEYLRDAIKNVNDRLGKDAAIKYPQITAAFILAAAHDFHAAVTVSGLQDIESAILLHKDNTLTE